MKEGSLDFLKKIWKRIPNRDESSDLLFNYDLLNKYLEIFHIGEFCYVIFNTKSADFDYIDSKVFNILGIPLEKFTLENVLEKIHPNDIDFFLTYEKKAVKFFSNLDENLLYKYKFSYDYRIKVGIDQYKRILQQTTPIQYFDDGGARTLVVFTDISHLKIDGIPVLSFIGLDGAPSYYNIYKKFDFLLCEKIFTKRETEILSLMVSGKTSEQISNLLFISIYTVNNHRKNILRKSGCATINELIVKSIREGWV